MKILEFEFKDKSRNWILANFKLDQLNLLLGISGVGKTQILRSLMILKEMSSQGNSINGIEWKIKFNISSNQEYVWEGAFENNVSSFFTVHDAVQNSQKSKIIFEKLSLNDQLIINRNENDILLNGTKTVKLAQEQSVIYLLKDEEKIKPVYQAIIKLKSIDYSRFNSGDFGDTNFDNPDNVEYLLAIDQFYTKEQELIKKFDTLKKIQFSNLFIIFKLYLIQKIDPALFNTIKQRFSEIFPQIEDLKIAPLQQAPEIFKNIFFIQIKEKSIKDWIDQRWISSGMLKTLLHLSELYLCAEGTVFLIDEFENSLGVNCINEITQDILTSDRDLQFILTSHHPYIIDGIGFEHWKLVTKTAGVVKVQNMDKFNIGKSKHSAFMQLIQLEAYNTGQD